MVDKILSSDVNVNVKNKINTNSNQNNTPSEKSKQNLYSAIDRLFKTPSKNSNAKNLYSWILLNVKDFETTENGNIITPLKNINIFDFMKDIFSKTSYFTSEKLNIYKIFVSIIDLPSNFIENKTIREYIFPNTKIDNVKVNVPLTPKYEQGTKRKYHQPSDSDNESVTSPTLTPARAKTMKLEKWVSRAKKQYPTRLRVRQNITGSGSNNNNTNFKKDNVLKWISY